MWNEAKKQEWYKKGGMTGYVWSKETLLKAEKSLKDPKLKKTKIQKYLLKNSLDLSAVDWHYFNNMTNKDIQLLKHALKKVNKNNVVSELHWIESRSGMLRTPLTRAMHVLAYKLQPEKYIAGQARIYKSYGMDEGQGKERAKSIVENFEKGLSKPW